MPRLVCAPCMVESWGFTALIAKINFIGEFIFMFRLSRVVIS